jgi:hypothetical protein
MAKGGRNGHKQTHVKCGANPHEIRERPVFYRFAEIAVFKLRG